MSKPCPSCGYCPTCGKANISSYPSYPYRVYYPWWQTPVYPGTGGTYTVTTAGSSSTDSPSGITYTIN